MRNALSAWERKVVPSVLGCVVLLAAGCMSSDGSDKPSGSPSPSVTQDFATLSSQAHALLSAAGKPALEGTVDARVGVPDTQFTDLKAGHYVLEAACVGTGALRVHEITKTGHSGLVPYVNCGKGLLRLPFEGGDLLTFGLHSNHETSGAVAWQVIPARS